MGKSEKYSKGLACGGVVENVAYTFIYYNLCIMATENNSASRSYL